MKCPLNNIFAEKSVRMLEISYLYSELKVSNITTQNKWKHKQ